MTPLCVATNGVLATTTLATATHGWICNGSNTCGPLCITTFGLLAGSSLATATLGELGCCDGGIIIPPEPVPTPPGGGYLSGRFGKMESLDPAWYARLQAEDEEMVAILTAAVFEGLLQ